MWQHNQTLMYSDSLYHHGTKGMKWGVRRYQNKDGTLTKAGVKRYERDQRENGSKKKGEKVGSADANRWVREDMERSKNFADSGSRMTGSLDRINKSTSNFVEPKRMNLSEMSDKEMRDRINREYLERQYDDMFSPKKNKTGREYLSKTLTIAGDVLAVGSSALGIALAVQQLKHGKV